VEHLLRSLIACPGQDRAASTSVETPPIGDTGAQPEALDVEAQEYPKRRAGDVYRRINPSVFSVTDAENAMHSFGIPQAALSIQHIHGGRRFRRHGRGGCLWR
jgi:hypothetical protein